MLKKKPAPVETAYICPQCGKDTTVDDFCSKRCEIDFVAEEAAWAKTLFKPDTP